MSQSLHTDQGNSGSKNRSTRASHRSWRLNPSIRIRAIPTFSGYIDFDPCPGWSQSLHTDQGSSDEDWVQGTAEDFGEVEKSQSLNTDQGSSDPPGVLR